MEIVSKENVKLKMGNSRRYPIVHDNRLKLDKADDLQKVSADVIELLDMMRTGNKKKDEIFCEAESRRHTLDVRHISKRRFSRKI